MCGPDTLLKLSRFRSEFMKSLLLIEYLHILVCPQDRSAFTLARRNATPSELLLGRFGGIDCVCVDGEHGVFLPGPTFHVLFT